MVTFFIKRLLILLVLCSSVLLYAQRPAQRTYWFHQLSTVDGLSNSNISCLLEDSRGCIWIGTESGANVYDGYKVRALELNKSLGMAASDVVHSIQEDYLGNIWVNYNGGFVVSVDFNETRNAAEYLNTLGIPMTKEAYVHIDEKGGIWCLDDKKLYHLNLKNNRKYEFDSKIDFSFHNDIYVSSCNDQLFVSHHEKLHRFDLATKSWSEVVLPKEISDLGDRVKCFHEEDGTLWVYSLQSELVFRQRPEEETWEKVNFPEDKNGFSKNQVRDICKSRSGRIWIATDHQGVLIVNEDLSLYKTIRAGAYRNEALTSDNVACIISDHRGAMWLGHYKKGVSVTHPSFGLFDNHEGDYRDVGALLCASDGTLWLGSDGFGVYTEKNGFVTKQPIPNTIASGIAEDKNGGIWVGTYGEGIYYLKGNTVRNLKAEKGELIHNNCWHLVADENGVIWYLSGWNALAYYNPETGKSETYKTSKDEDVTGDMIYFDKASGNIYVGTYWGLCEIEPSGQEHFYYGNASGKQDFLSMQITSIAIDRENDIWWLGHPIGLTVWDRKNDHLYFLNKDLGLCDNKIVQIVCTEEGKVWISTNNGLMQITTSVQTSGTLSFAIEPFSTSEGLMDNYFNPASSVDKDNNIYFGSASGYININLDQFVSDSEGNLSPKVVSCSVNGGTIPLTGLRELQHTDHDIEINFFTKEILDAHSVKYSYMIEGMNESWVYTRDPKVYFLSLQPGDYRLNVRACGLDGVWGQTTVIPIHVGAPITQSIWFKVLLNIGAIIVFLCLAFIFIWRYRARLRKMHEELEEDSTERVIDLKLQFFGNLNSDLRKPVKKILSRLDRVIGGEYPQEDVPMVLSGVREVTNKLDRNLSTLLDFRRLETGGEFLTLTDFNFVDVAREMYDQFSDSIEEKKIRASFETNEDEIMMHGDDNKLRRVVYHLLSNAFKHSSVKGKVSLSIQLSEGKVQMDVADTGRGIPDEEKEHIFKRFFQSQEQFLHTGSGIGLTLVWHYVKMHGGTITFKENEPRGTVFTVILPLSAQQKVKEETFADDVASIANGNFFDIKNGTEVEDDDII